jgi:hypothetical protein
MVRSWNGSEVPLESVEERVVREEGGTKVVERITRRYDANGRPGPAERSVIEKRTGEDGSSTVVETTYRGDINGRMQLWERSTTETAREGSGERADTKIERQGPNAAMELVEKKTSVTRATNGGTEQDTLVYRRAESGRLYEAAREVIERTTDGGKTIENTARYEAPSPGQLRLTAQTVKRTSEESGGSRTEVDVYSADIAGRPSGKLQLREQQLIERRASSGDGFVETVSVRRPDINDPKRLGRFEKVEEISCSGDCEGKKTPEQAPDKN